MTNKRNLDFHMDNQLQRIQQERKEIRLLLSQNEIKPDTFEKRDVSLMRELENLFIQRNIEKILF